MTGKGQRVRRRLVVLTTNFGTKKGLEIGVNSHSSFERLDRPTSLGSCCRC